MHAVQVHSIQPVAVRLEVMDDKYWWRYTELISTTCTYTAHSISTSQAAIKLLLTNMDSKANLEQGQ